MEWVWVDESVCGFFKRNSLGLQKFLPPTQFPLVFAARSCRDLTSWHWNSGLGGLMWGYNSSLTIFPSQIFIHHTCGTSPFPVCAPPTSLHGCSFFNSVVVRLPFNSVSDVSEWWLFYIFVVISMWLCNEESHVCLPNILERVFWWPSGCLYLAVEWLGRGICRCTCGEYKLLQPLLRTVYWCRKDFKKTIYILQLTVTIPM